MAEVLEPEGGGEPETGLGISPAAAMAVGARKGRAGGKADAVYRSPESASSAVVEGNFADA